MATEAPLGFRDAGHGYDVFGLAPRVVARAAAMLGPLYRSYFRVRAIGIEHVPARGGAILIANHSGVLPVDGAMLWADVYHQTGRILRPIADHFVPSLPFVGTAFARLGVVGGSRANVRRLLDEGELIAIFPEGVTGVAKSFRDRYQLQDWRVGHAELAIRHGVPIVPVAIVGAEESWPLAWRSRRAPFGAPYLPIPWSPVPLPVGYRLWYGPPIDLHREYGPDAADDPALVARAAARTRDVVQQLVIEARRARKGSP